MAGRRSTYAEYVFETADARGLSLAGFAQLVRSCGHPVADGSVRNWSSGVNRIPRAAVPAIGEALGIPERDVAMVEERFGPQRWPSRPRGRRDARPPADPFRASLSGAIEARERLAAQIAIVEQRSLDLLGALDQRHFFVSTTTAIRNYLWYEPHELGGPGQPPDLLAGRVAAIRRRALFLMLVPNKVCFDGVRGWLGRTAALDDHGAIARGYTVFRDRAVRELGEDAAAAELFDAQQQLLEVGEFPFTAAGWTVNLLGEKQGPAQIDRHVMIHGPYSNGLSLQLWHQPNHFFPGWLSGWVEKVVSDEADRLAGDDSARARFFRQLRERMRYTV